MGLRPGGDGGHVRLQGIVAELRVDDAPPLLRVPRVGHPHVEVPHAVVELAGVVDVLCLRPPLHQGGDAREERGVARAVRAALGVEVGGVQVERPRIVGAGDGDTRKLRAGEPRILGAMHPSISPGGSRHRSGRQRSRVGPAHRWRAGRPVRRRPRPHRRFRGRAQSVTMQRMADAMRVPCGRRSLVLMLRPDPRRPSSSRPPLKGALTPHSTVWQW